MLGAKRVQVPFFIAKHLGQSRGAYHLNTLSQQSLPHASFAQRQAQFSPAAIILLLGVLLMTLPGPARAGQACEVMDATGREMTISLPIRRLVVLNSDALEAVRILGAQKLVVGVYDRIPQAPHFWGELSKLPVVGSWRDPDCEAIAALRPDLVLAYGYTPGPQLDKRLKLLGIPVLRLDFYRLATLDREIAQLGRVLGKGQEAGQFIQWQDHNLDMLKSLIARGKVRPRVYMEGYSRMQAVGPGSSGYAMCRDAGGDPISSALSIPHPKISTEWLLRENPQVIVKVSNLMDSYDSGKADALRRIWRALRDRRGWQNLAAVRNHRVHVLAQDIWVGPGMLIGMAYLTKWFYPEVCKDLKPRQLHREYLARFQGLPLHGRFVYPDKD